MKGRNIVYWALLLLAASCVREKEGIEIKESVLATRSVTLNGGMEDVSVLIFGRNDPDFTYQSCIVSGWDAQGKTSARLEIGEYKFLFFKFTGVHTFLDPKLLTDNVTFENIKVKAEEDETRNGYVWPADELWLPESAAMANEIYSIQGGETVQNKLTRAVGKIVLQLKRGISENGKIDSLPYPEGETIMEDIEKVSLDITGVGEAVSVNGGIGNSKVFWETAQASRITESGFAVLEGPFVFPSGTGEETKVDIVLLPKAGSAFPELSKQVKGRIERNKRLVITLWITSTYKFIGITVKTDPISTEIDGDQGIWN